MWPTQPLDILQLPGDLFFILVLKQSMCHVQIKSRDQMTSLFTFVILRKINFWVFVRHNHSRRSELPWYHRKRHTFFSSISHSMASLPHAMMNHIRQELSQERLFDMNICSKINTSSLWTNSMILKTVIFEKWVWIFSWVLHEATRHVNQKVTPPSHWHHPNFTSKHARSTFKEKIFWILLFQKLQETCWIL